MKQKLIISLMLASLLGFSISHAESPVLMSYNVHNAAGLDKVFSTDRIAGIIGQADIVAIQETDSMTGRRPGVYVLGEIARAAGMHPTFAPAIDYRGGKYGIGILSREKPLSVRRVALPGREEARTMVIAEFDSLFFACVHLSLTEADRMASLPLIMAEAEKASKPFYLAGDWNSVPSSPFIAAIGEKFTILSDTTLLTFPADKPVEVLDYIAVYGKSGRGGVSATVLPETEASDHRPVLVRIH